MYKLRPFLSSIFGEFQGLLKDIISLKIDFGIFFYIYFDHIPSCPCLSCQRNSKFNSPLIYVIYFALQFEGKKPSSFVSW